MLAIQMTTQAGNSRRSRAACRQQAAERALAIAPETRFAALENRAFLHRAVRYVAERGVRQYIDIGSGYPTVGPVHEVAGQIVADPHGAYVDYDPDVARLIDWSEPVAVLMVATLHFVTDAESPNEIIATFRDHMAPGSYLILSHGTHGETPDAAEEAIREWDDATSRVTLRTPTAIEDLFTGFELISPGLVTTTEWGTAKPAPTDQGLILAGVGRVP